MSNSFKSWTGVNRTRRYGMNKGLRVRGRRPIAGVTARNHIHSPIRKLRVTILLLVLAVLFSSTARGAVIKVPDDYSSIQSAINAAQSGDIIWVAQGTYDENLGLKDNIELQGGWKSDFSGRDWNTWPSIIDGGGRGSVVTNAQTVGTILDGFTIRNGNSWGGGGILVQSAVMTIKNNTIENNSGESYGGGIFVYSAPPAPPYMDIENNIIRNNQVTGINGRGGGICVWHSGNSVRIGRNTIGGEPGKGNRANHKGGGIYLEETPIFWVENNIVTNNETESGGGIFVVQGSPNSTIKGNIIKDNTAVSSGGGIFLDGGTRVIGNDIERNILPASELSYGGGIWIRVREGASPPKLTNNFIHQNEARNGGGVYAWGTDIHIINNTIAYNKPEAHETGGGVHVESGSACILKNTILWGNGDDLYGDGVEGSYIHYNDIEDGDFEGVNGNISKDPLFVSVEDLHITKGSPCVDAGHAGGAPSDDYDGDQRDAKVDIGADELVSQPSPCPFVKAARASSLEPHLDGVRDFRDRFLLTHSMGRSFVRFYYHVSPPIADYLGRHETLRVLTQCVLTPVVYSIEHCGCVLELGLASLVICFSRFKSRGTKRGITARRQ